MDTKAADSAALRAAANTEAVNRLARYATYASVSVALMLVSIKTAAWFTTESVAVLSSLVDSMLDVLASFVTLLAIRHSSTALSMILCCIFDQALVSLCFKPLTTLIGNL